MKTIRFNPAGGPLSAEVRAGFAQPGSYTLMLWAANQNSIIWQRKGNFINTDDDAFELPGQASEHEGRLLDCLATLTITPPIRDYRLDLIVSQDGAELDRDFASGVSDQPTVTLELFIQLEAEG